MPKSQTDEIQEINTIVEASLKMLGGAGGHKAGLKGVLGSVLTTPTDAGSLSSAMIATTNNLKGALAVVRGISLDNWHQGYKGVTMNAFRVGLQSILNDHYIALKLLESREEYTRAFQESEELQNKLKDKASRTHILQVLGFSKSEIKQISSEITKDSTYREIADVIKDYVKAGEVEDRKQRIQFMINGALCYVPFAEPNDGHQFNIPMLDPQGKFQRPKMTLERINMSPGIEGPYYALHLKPEESATYTKELMIFMGTNPLPTASGPSVTLHADTIPNKGVGENFVEGSRDLLENFYLDRYKENLKKLITLAHTPGNNDFKNKDGTINYQKIWLDARVKCVGQSLGASIPLQMLVKYPFMVEIGAFEPPFLLDKHARQMQRNLARADKDFTKIVTEVSQDLNIEGFQPEKLIESLPKPQAKLTQEEKERQVPSLEDTLKKNNTVIVQLFDFVTKYGTYCPPAQIYHVDSNAASPKYHKTTDKLYQSLMATSVMSHAMVLAGQRDKVIREIDNDVNSATRSNFTGILHKMVWKGISPPLATYFSIKHFFQSHIHDAKQNPSDNPAFREENIRLLKEEITGKWETIQKGLDTIDLPHSWQNGGHLLQKIQELGRLQKRMENLDNQYALEMRSKIEAQIQSQFANNPTDKTRIYLRHLNQAMGRLPENLKNDLHNQTLHALNNSFNAYDILLQDLKTHTLHTPSRSTAYYALKQQRQEVIELYSLLDPKDRCVFLNDATSRNQIFQTSLLKDLNYHAHSPEEKRILKDLLEQQKTMHQAVRIESSETKSSQRKTKAPLFSMYKLNSQQEKKNKKDSAKSTSHDKPTKNKPT